MLLENQIREGDVAIVNGTGGLVEHVGLRTIVLRDLSGVVHVFQNGKVNTLSNMTKRWSGMVFDIGVAYKEDTDRVHQVIKSLSPLKYSGWTSLPTVPLLLRPGSRPSPLNNGPLAENFADG